MPSFFQSDPIIVAYVGACLIFRMIRHHTAPLHSSTIAMMLLTIKFLFFHFLPIFQKSIWTTHSQANFFLTTANKHYRPWPSSTPHPRKLPSDIITPPFGQKSLKQSSILWVPLVCMPVYGKNGMERWFIWYSWLESLWRTFSCLTRCRQISITKLSHGLWNTNHHNSKYYGTSPVCPCCHDDIQTLIHVLNSLQKDVKEHQNQQLSLLDEDLDIISTPTLLHETVNPMY